MPTEAEKTKKRIAEAMRQVREIAESLGADYRDGEVSAEMFAEEAELGFRNSFFGRAGMAADQQRQSEE